MNSISSSVLVVHCIKSADGFTQLYFSASKPVYIVHIQKLPRSVIDHAGFLSIAMGLVQEHVCILVVDFSYFFFSVRWAHTNVLCQIQRTLLTSEIRLNCARKQDGFHLCISERVFRRLANLHNHQPNSPT